MQHGDHRALGPRLNLLGPIKSVKVYKFSKWESMTLSHFSLFPKTHLDRLPNVELSFPASLQGFMHRPTFRRREPKPLRIQVA